MLIFLRLLLKNFCFEGVVDDMFKFENVGFLKTVNQVKLLTCAGKLLELFLFI